jgi:hypothetical protein
LPERGFGTLFGTWLALIFGGPVGGQAWLSHFYLGYSITLTGGLIGLIWGFFHGLIGGALFAWFYNRLIS